MRIGEPVLHVLGVLTGKSCKKQKKNFSEMDFKKGSFHPRAPKDSKTGPYPTRPPKQVALGRKRC